MNQDEQHDQSTTRAVTLTEDHLQEYTEHAVATAMEQARPSHKVTRAHLLKTRDELERIFSDLRFDRSVQRWDLTSADARAIEQANDLELVLELRSITKLRTHIRRLRRAIARLEAARSRHHDRIAAESAKSTARELEQIEKERAEHLAEVAGTRHGTSCQRCHELQMNEAVVRVVSTAPPLSTNQILEIRQLLDT